MRYSFLILFFLVVLLSSGCESTNKTDGLNLTVQVITRKFNGTVGNLLGDGRVTTLNSECRGFGRGPTDDGKYWAEFDLTPGGPTNPPTEFHLFFIFPTLPTGQILVTNTESRAVDVWFFRSDANYSNVVCVIKNNQELLKQRGGEKMTGRVAIKWNSDADFVIGADLTLPENSSTWARGEFVGDAKTELNPVLYDWPGTYP